MGIYAVWWGAKELTDNFKTYSQSIVQRSPLANDKKANTNKS